MILTDTEIRALCADLAPNVKRINPMLEPFSEGVQGNNVISFGLSHAGYDMRLGSTVLIFKNTFNEVIDPKKFKNDPKYHSRLFDKIEDIPTGEQVMIPPHSYILGYTLEYIRMPNNLKGRCVGKSTLARCFSGDTKVLLTNGKSESFTKMMNKPDERRWGIGVCEKTGHYQVTELVNPKWVGRENLVRITLDNGETIDCTPDHEFLRHGGFYSQAEELQPNQGIVPLYRKKFRGRKAVWLPQAKRWLPLYWLSDEWNLRNNVYGDEENTHRHHRDHDKNNDNPNNLERKNANLHIKEHNAEYYGNDTTRLLHGGAIREAMATLMKDPEWMKVYRQAQSERAIKFWTEPEYQKVREARSEKLRNSWNADRRAEQSKTITELWTEVEFRQKQHESHRKSWTAERRESHAQKMREYHKRRQAGNHTIISVKSLKGLHDVFCVTSADTGNFTLKQGVVTKNCGVIINTTPIEPGWEGHLTLEIANVTPCPLVVYCGEGICQIEFEMLTGVCNQDYAAKGNGGGKYQGQRATPVPARTVE